MTEQTAPAPAPADPPARPLEQVVDLHRDPSALEAALRGRRPALFLDYDGTLTPIVARPDLAVLSGEGRAVVDAVARALPVAVISGRDRPDVERLVGLQSLIYAGSHGFDVTVPGKGELRLHGLGDFTALLNDAGRILLDGLGGISGALVERKKFSIAAHYRLIDDADYPRFRAVLDGMMERLDGLKEKPGKKVFEFQPDIDWDKGRCVLHLLGALGLEDPDTVAIFLGDDVTDEDAFRALENSGRGFGIVVAGPEDDGRGRTTHARFRLPDPDAVLAFLARLTP